MSSAAEASGGAGEPAVVCLRGGNVMNDRPLAHRWRRRWRRVLASVAAVGVLAALTACVSGPPQPTTGLGSNTPCGRTDVQLTDPGAPSSPIYVSYPTGSAAAPLTGGTCGDAARPVVFLVHGYLANFNWVYEAVIDHFTRAGNIVVMATYGTDLADVQGS